jgi:hypothetical protein
MAAVLRRAATISEGDDPGVGTAGGGGSASWLVQATTDEEEKLTWGRRESPDAISGNSEGTRVICLRSLVCLLSSVSVGLLSLVFFWLVFGLLLLPLLLPSLHFLRRLYRPLCCPSKSYFFFVSRFIFLISFYLGLGTRFLRLTILPLERWVLFADEVARPCF